MAETKKAQAKAALARIHAAARNRTALKPAYRDARIDFDWGDYDDVIATARKLGVMPAARCRCHMASSSISVACPRHGWSGYDFGNPS